MKELPYFKFHPNQWITGSISFLELDQQGAFMKLCCYYWSKECNVTYKQYTAIVPEHCQTLIEFGIVKESAGFIKIDWLDDQLKERKQAHNKRVKAGTKGGNATAKLYHKSSNAIVLRKDKKREDNIRKDNIKEDTKEVYIDPALSPKFIE